MANMAVVTPTSAPITIRSILFATDFSTISDRALKYALAIAKAVKSRLFVVHALPAAPPPSSDFGVREFDSHRREIADHLRVLKNSGALKEVECSVILEHGGVWEVLAKTIEQKKVDLIVIGTHGRGGLTKLILGSTAEEVFRVAPCPVLTVGPHVPDPPTGPPFRQILVATDYSAGSLHALPYALSLAQTFQARVAVVHAVDPFTITTQASKIQEQERERLKVLVPRDTSVAVEFQVQFGLPADVILNIAEKQKADLIVMGVHATGALAASTHLPGAITHRVVCCASCPVLTVKSGLAE